MVERQLPKLNVVGSIPIARSISSHSELIEAVDQDDIGSRRAVAVLGQGPVFRISVPAPGVLGRREAHDYCARHGPFALDDLRLQAAAHQLAAVALEDVGD